MTAVGCHLAAIWTLLVVLLILHVKPSPETVERLLIEQHSINQEEPTAPVPPAHSDSAHADSLRAATAAVAQQVGTAEAPPPIPAEAAWAPPIRLGQDAATALPLGNVSSTTLVSELHTRRYGWEVLHAARLDFRDFSELELISWLKRDRQHFRSVLQAASLGLGSYGSVELLREVSARPDLALAETRLHPLTSPYTLLHPLQVGPQGGPQGAAPLPSQAASHAARPRSACTVALPIRVPATAPRDCSCHGACAE